MDGLRGRTRGRGARRAAGGGARALGETDGTGAKKQRRPGSETPNLRAAARARGAGRALAHDACPTRTRVVVNVAGGHIVAAWRESGGKSRLQPRRTRGCFQWRPTLRARRWLVGRCLVGKRVPRHACAVRGARCAVPRCCGERGSGARGEGVCVISRLVHLFDISHISPLPPTIAEGEMAGEGIRVGLNKGESNLRPRIRAARACAALARGQNRAATRLDLRGRRSAPLKESRLLSSLSLSRAPLPSAAPPRPLTPVAPPSSSVPCRQEADEAQHQQGAPQQAEGGA
jgi:hypothetical protein